MKNKELYDFPQVAPSSAYKIAKNMIIKEVAERQSKALKEELMRHCH